MMYCPYGCKAKTIVVDSRKLHQGTKVRRRRECPKCKRRITTKEVIIETLINKEKEKSALWNILKECCMSYGITGDAIINDLVIVIQLFNKKQFLKDGTNTNSENKGTQK